MNNIRNPLHVARKTKSFLAAHANMWKFGNHGRQHFQGDARYDLQNVTSGFADHIGEASDETYLLDRICSAYNEAERQQRSLGGAYQLSEPLHRLQQGILAPSIHALREHDTSALGEMYRNFYRDPCSAGLLAAPNGMSKSYFRPHIKDVYRHFYLSHVLYRLDYWNHLTEGRFSLEELAGPGIGNPFGVVIDKTHIGVGAEYAHYCAQRVGSLVELIETYRPTVAEIGGGFGAVAYYLLRDYRPLAYLNFDTPERIALSSYYLMKAFPYLTFLLYGEKPLTQEAISEADVSLIPIFALAAMPNAAVDITFSSDGIASLAPSAKIGCLRRIVEVTRGSVLYFGKEASSQLIAEIMGEGLGRFVLVDRRTSGWHSHKVSGAGVGGAVGLSHSTLFEQTFGRESAVIQPVADAVRISYEEGTYRA